MSKQGSSNVCQSSMPGFTHTSQQYRAAPHIPQYTVGPLSNQGHLSNPGPFPNQGHLSNPSPSL